MHRNIYIIHIGLPPPRDFRHTLHNYDVSFFWEDPVLPDDIQLTNYIISYNVTDAFNQSLNSSILISSKDNNYVFNMTCGYETGLTLCPASHYCFTLKGIYNKNKTVIETIPTNTTCFTTSDYRKL